ncbi:uncharacterized protein LOC113157685 isoform X2 [Anabas testudineus]|uniref:uncharacterized protein LOC113157685 isoform X2 n=1 Tax=Anabas testudineus TaxID=64144 RepID=UPI000E45D25F|nr:uncharacterized protein LOC113157685 isoform X2 [Anabas testudineus]
MNRVEMIWILLVLTTSSVYGEFAMKMTSTFYETGENNHITIKWDSKTKLDLSLTNLICVSRSNIFKVLYQMIRGLEVPKSVHKQFSRRVVLDRDDLREGRIRLHLFIVTAEDSGDYSCDLTADYNEDTRKWGLQATVHFVLNVTKNSPGAISSANNDEETAGAKQLLEEVMSTITPLTTLIGAAVLLGYLIVRRASNRRSLQFEMRKVSSLTS